MKFKTIKKYLYLYIVNHVLAGTTKFFECKRKLLCEIGYEIGARATSLLNSTLV